MKVQLSRMFCDHRHVNEAMRNTGCPDVGLGDPSLFGSGRGGNAIRESCSRSTHDVEEILEQR